MNNKKDIEEDIENIYDLLQWADDNNTDVTKECKSLENILADRERLEVKANAYDSLVEKIKKDIEEYPEATYTKYYLLECLELLDTEK